MSLKNATPAATQTDVDAATPIRCGADTSHSPSEEMHPESLLVTSPSRENRWVAFTRTAMSSYYLVGVVVKEGCFKRLEEDVVTCILYSYTQEALIFSSVWSQRLSPLRLKGTLIWVWHTRSRGPSLPTTCAKPHPPLAGRMNITLNPT